jgi:hypothetical protein
VTTQILRHKVSYETRFVSKEPKLVLTLYETKRLVLFVSGNSKTASFGVSVEAKLTNSGCETTVLIEFNPMFPPFFVFK